MERKHEEHHHQGCCGGSHHHEHFENPFEVELAKQIDEFLKNREKSALALHSEDCRCCGSE